MNYINIGKYVNTHGIKGEIRIISNFSRKDLVFVPGTIIYIGDNKKEYKIKTYRRHKNYDMITLYNVDNINDIEYLKNSNIYIDKNILNVDYLLEDLLDYIAIIDNKEYKILDIIEDKENKILVLDKKIMVPFVDEFIIKVDSKNKKVYIKNMEGLVL
jgi:16S rRNA processing protein RimM